MEGIFEFQNKKMTMIVYIEGLTENPNWETCLFRKFLVE